MSLWTDASYKGIPGPYPIRLGAYANFKYKIIEKAPQSFLDLAFVKNYLKVTQDVDDQLIGFLINSVIKFCENWTKKDLTETKYETYRDFFYQNFYLKRAPFLSVEKIEYLKNKVYTLVDSDIYYTYEIDPYSSIIIQNNKSWPSDVDNVFNCIKITFNTGFLEVPYDLQTALLAHISYLYQQRGDCDCDALDGNSVPIQSKQVYDSYRIQEPIIYRQAA